MKYDKQAPIGFHPIIYKNEPIAWAIIPQDDKSRITIIGCDRLCIETLISLPPEEKISFREREISMKAIRTVFKGRIIDAYKTYSQYVTDEVETIEGWAR